MILMFQLNKFAQEVEHEVRTTVIQVVETTSGRVGNNHEFQIMNKTPIVLSNFISN